MPGTIRLAGIVRESIVTTRVSGSRSSARGVLTAAPDATTLKATISAEAKTAASTGSWRRSTRIRCWQA